MMKKIRLIGIIFFFLLVQNAAGCAPANTVVPVISSAVASELEVESTTAATSTNTVTATSTATLESTPTVAPGTTPTYTLGPTSTYAPITNTPPIPFNIVSIAVGGYHTCAITAGGGVKCWGSDGDGELGNGTQGHYTTPVGVVGLSSGVAAIAAGQYQTCALTTEGGVKCWGSGYAKTPMDIDGLTGGVVAISGILGHTCALTAGGGVKCWGANGTGELGDGTKINHSAPVDVTGLTSGVSAIAAGGQHTCALTDAGGVKCWGFNYGVTPVDIRGLSSGVTAIASGGYHACALTSEGIVKCWGRNDYGQLGAGGVSDMFVSTPVTVLGLTSPIRAISAGYRQTCALTAEGGLKCWGGNQYGQVGDGTNVDRTAPTDVVGLTGGVAAVSAGGWHTCAVMTYGGAKCWGANTWGELGNGKDNFNSNYTGPSEINNNSNIPVDVSGLNGGIRTISADRMHTCALPAAGGVKCWGSNFFGQLGDGTKITRNLPVDGPGMAHGYGAVEVDSADIQTCVIDSRGLVHCWGSDYHGNLADGISANGVRVDLVFPSLVPIDHVSAISGGWLYFCALVSEGGVKCWGANQQGQLGDGTTTSSNAPVNVSGLTGGVIAISSSELHSCALTDAGGIKCWGGKYGLTPVNISGMTSGVIAISSGFAFDCAIMFAGGVKCWGENTYGQLGNGRPYTYASETPTDVTGLTSGVIAISTNINNACAVLSGGGVKCWGDNRHGQLGDGTTMNRNTPVDVFGLGSGIKDMSVGENHACALAVDGWLMCWGFNGTGQLGDGTYVERHTPIFVVGLIP